MKKQDLGVCIRSWFFIALVGVLSGCAYEQEKIAIEYEPTLFTIPVLAEESVSVDLNVRDVRKNKTFVSRKIGSHGEEAAQVRLHTNLKEEVSRAFTTELKSRGFIVESGGTEVKIDIEKFYNNFTPGSWKAKGNAEFILKVSVVKSGGIIVYEKTITGEGSCEKPWAYTGGNAKIPLEVAFNDGIHRIFADPSFLEAILSKGSRLL